MLKLLHTAHEVLKVEPKTEYQLEATRGSKSLDLAQSNSTLLLFSGTDQ